MESDYSDGDIHLDSGTDSHGHNELHGSWPVLSEE